MSWESLASTLPHLNALLNLLATVLLLVAFLMIRRNRIVAHRNIMLTAIVVSGLFLAGYLLHKVALYETTGVPNKRFPRDPAVASTAVFTTYLVILGTHLTLAITVPFLAVWAAWLGWKDRRSDHRRVVRWAFPIWIYVSVTGVIIYAMLYHLYAVPVT